MTAGSKELEPQERAKRVLCRNHPGTWKIGLLHELSPGDPGHEREEQKESTVLGSELARREVQASHIGDIGLCGPGTLGPLVVVSSRKPVESFFLQDQGHRRRASSLLLFRQRAADVVDGEVLFAKGDDLFSDAILLGAVGRLIAGGEEELAIGILP
jgi:hypothetical protein